MSFRNVQIFIFLRNWFIPVISDNPTDAIRPISGIPVPGHADWPAHALTPRMDQGNKNRLMQGGAAAIRQRCADNAAVQHFAKPWRKIIGYNCLQLLVGEEYDLD